MSLSIFSMIINVNVAPGMKKNQAIKKAVAGDRHGLGGDKEPELQFFWRPGGCAITHGHRAHALIKELLYPLAFVGFGGIDVAL